MSVLGVVMAGGRNTRFGDLKALTEVGGHRIIDRVIEVLRQVSAEVVLSANDADAYRSVALEQRSDLIPEVGALGGIHTALWWARERGHTGIVAVACDMPFPSAKLLQAVLDRADQGDAVLPESDSRRGLEPLFAYYRITCIPAIEKAIERGDHRMIGFHSDIAVERIPLSEVRAYGDPDVLFMNVNSRADLVRAQEIAEGR